MVQLFVLLKKLLWDSCAEALRSLNLFFQQRRDSDKQKQITADIEDLLLAFDALDSNDSTPPIFCEAIMNFLSFHQFHWILWLSRLRRTLQSCKTELL